MKSLGEVSRRVGVILWALALVGCGTLYGARATMEDVEGDAFPPVLDVVKVEVWLPRFQVEWSVAGDLGERQIGHAWDLTFPLEVTGTYALIQVLWGDGWETSYARIRKVPDGGYEADPMQPISLSVSEKGNRLIARAERDLPFSPTTEITPALLARTWDGGMQVDRVPDGGSFFGGVPPEPSPPAPS